METLTIDKTKPREEIYKECAWGQKIKQTGRAKNVFSELQINHFLDTIAEKIKFEEDKLNSISEQLIAMQSSKRKSNKQRFNAGCVAAAAAAFCFVCLSIILPIVLGGSPTEIKNYTAQDIKSNRISFDTFNNMLSETEGVVDFNPERFIFLEMPSTAFYETPINNELLNLSLAFVKALIYTSTGDVEIAFYVDYRVRLYKDYLFYQIENFDALNRSFIADGVKVNYKLLSTVDTVQAYICFTYHAYDYFFKVTSFIDEIPVNEDNLIILFDSLLK